jgi:SH3 domain-containing YSC84-like protein 1
MKNAISLCAKLAFIALAIVTCSWAETTREKAEDRLQRAARVLHDIVNTPDKGIPDEVIKHAKCMAVVPHEITVALGIGGRIGKGVATCRTGNGWSAPAFFNVTGGSWGAQIGIEGVDNVLMIMNEKGMQRLLSDKFQIGADASAAAGPVGRHAAAGTDWKLETEILSYSRAKGVFAGVSLNGAYVRPDRDANEAMYGPAVTPRKILSGKVPAPPAAGVFLAAVRDAEEKAETKS